MKIETKFDKGQTVYLIDEHWPLVKDETCPTCGANKKEYGSAVDVVVAGKVDSISFAKSGTEWSYDVTDLHGGFIGYRLEKDLFATEDEAKEALARLEAPNA